MSTTNRKSPGSTPAREACASSCSSASAAPNGTVVRLVRFTWTSRSTSLRRSRMNWRATSRPRSSVPGRSIRARSRTGLWGKGWWMRTSRTAK
ncbi:hypothetical protein [Actinomadura litoris]|uniref:hypothetical protein n=1 Tax=Actinomadura litoris TaxID=2678616 RepID=UPI001FA80C3D|nr:hypothetical protein [Actinomadura litoris]